MPKKYLKKNLRFILSILFLFGILFFVFVFNPATTEQTNEQYANLVGEWIRPDGGYKLLISSVDEQGNLTASYFNPNPIKIAEARVLRGKKLTKIFIKFDDKNYRGSTYTLNYSENEPFLQGKYYQALLKKTYDIIFFKQVNQG